MNRLHESSSNPLKSKSRRVLSGEFATFGVKNQNERIYPKQIYEAALSELMPKIREGRLMGECDHPEYDEVRLANVSHVIKECSVKGNKLYGTVELLDTPAGKVIQAIVEAGIPVGISSRGIGNTRRITEGTEVTDLKLITFDLVADPSFEGAILTESAKVTLKRRLSSIEKTLPLNESSGENQLIRNKIHDIRESIDKAPSMTTTLVESIGDLTTKNMELEDKLSESVQRNESLRSNMEKIQESVDQLETELKQSKREVSKMKRVHESKERKLVESYESQILELSKELAIEKRGLSVDNTMPLLEGLTSMTEIENKLDSLKVLGRRRNSSIPNVTLTEGATSSRKSELSTIISRV